MGATCDRSLSLKVGVLAANAQERRPRCGAHLRVHEPRLEVLDGRSAPRRVELAVWRCASLSLLRCLPCWTRPAFCGALLTANGCSVTADCAPVCGPQGHGAAAALLEVVACALPSSAFDCLWRAAWPSCRVLTHRSMAVAVILLRLLLCMRVLQPGRLAWWSRTSRLV